MREGGFVDGRFHSGERRRVMREGEFLFFFLLSIFLEREGVIERVIDGGVRWRSEGRRSQCGFCWIFILFLYSYSFLFFSRA